MLLAKTNTTGDACHPQPSPSRRELGVKNTWMPACQDNLDKHSEIEIENFETLRLWCHRIRAFILIMAYSWNIWIIWVLIMQACSTWNRSVAWAAKNEKMCKKLRIHMFCNGISNKELAKTLQNLCKNLKFLQYFAKFLSIRTTLPRVESPPTPDLRSATDYPP